MILLILTLLDGSSINLSVPEKAAWTMETKYGKLVVPLSDIQDCYLGVHYDNEQEYINAFGKLSSDVHAERDAATKFLQRNKRGAYQYVKLGLKSRHLEQVKRCEQLIKEYDDIFPVLFDEINVNGFGNVRGTIKVMFVEGASDSLGALKVRISQIRSISLRTKKAAKINPSLDWQDFGHVKGRLSIRVAGDVDFFPAQPGQFIGKAGGVNGGLQGGYPPGAVIGKVGTKTFLVGERFDTDNMDAGTLYLKVNQTGWNSIPTGEFEVTID